MPETITITKEVYRFDELSDKAKQRACDKAKQRACDDWAHYVIDNAKEEGKAQGFAIDRVMWSGFHSQGSGASWQGCVELGTFLDHHLTPERLDHHRYVVLRELIRDGWIDDRVNVYTNGFRYSHSGTMVFDDIDTSILRRRVNYPGEYPTENGSVSQGVLQGADAVLLARSIEYEALCNDLFTWLVDSARAYANKVYADLEDEYEYETSEAHVAEMSEANEWRYTEHGEYLAEVVATD